MSVPSACCPSVMLSDPHLLQHYMQHSLTSMHCLHGRTLVTRPLFFTPLHRMSQWELPNVVTSLHHMSQWKLPNVVTDLMLMGRHCFVACSST